ncbi:60S ribosomal protein L2, mitochondrial [Capsicum baccatum]|uniref:60S ribosomal protein L2, mitochondrial n=1 Tax=Capsicum baccatum TaxID=33114 RepID=A0A2G2VSU5_CAPBA|nr:60S ribosomal protein L2, mitochondrial [Capsicum baccatum]
MRQKRALRQFTLSTGKSTGRNSSGRITVFHQGGGSKRLQRRINLKQKTESIGIVERIERAPNCSFRIAPAKGETASLSFGSSFGFPRTAAAFFSPRMREKVRGKNTFSLCEIQKWRTHSILWVHRIKHKAGLSWQSFRLQKTLGLIGASERNESKPKTDQGSLLAKLIDEGLKDGKCKVDHARVV